MGSNAITKYIPVIGIDLGTTQCCVGVYTNGKVNIIPNDSQDNSKTTPSYVTFHKDGLYSFGHEAKEKTSSYRATTIYDIKRMMGKSWTDITLQEDIKNWPFEVVNMLGSPKVKTWNRTRHPHEVSARLLTQFRVMADRYLNLPVGSVRRAVITVPAHFNDHQRRATREAALCAGLELVDILNEPSASVIAYTWENRNSPKKVLVYDLGDRSFAASVVTTEKEQVTIVTTHVDHQVGHQDFIKLKNLNAGVTGYRLQELYRPLVDKTLDIVDAALETAKSSSSGISGKDDIDDIILVGDSEMLSDISSMISEHFNGKKLCNSIHTEHVVAYGASVQGHLYEDTEHFIDEVLSVEVHKILSGTEDENIIDSYVGNNGSKMEAPSNDMVWNNKMKAPSDDFVYNSKVEAPPSNMVDMLMKQEASINDLSPIGSEKDPRPASNLSAVDLYMKVECVDAGLVQKANTYLPKCVETLGSSNDAGHHLKTEIQTVRIIGNCVSQQKGTISAHVPGIDVGCVVTARVDADHPTSGEVKLTCKIYGLGDTVYVGVKFRKQLAMGSSGIKIEHVDNGEGYCDTCKGRKSLFIPAVHFGASASHLFQIQ